MVVVDTLAVTAAALAVLAAAVSAAAAQVGIGKELKKSPSINRRAF